VAPARYTKFDLIRAANVRRDFLRVDFHHVRVLRETQPRSDEARRWRAPARIFRAGNQHADFVESRHHRSANSASVWPAGHERLERIGELDAFLERQAGEGLADVELLAVAVEVAMIVRGKRLALFILPPSRPLASGRRMSSATFRFFASAKSV